MSEAAPDRTSPRRRWSLRRKVAASFALLIVLLAALGRATIASLIHFADRGQEVIDRWQPAVLTSQDLFSDLLNEETSVRSRRPRSSRSSAPATPRPPARSRVRAESSASS
ncbi:MAG: hypothetical protein DLM58_20615 [Pseudonocardiales bacterium]|nr:MAG: hypothetical protein DLM58_20615 [Pseudonocardiales bacterium]